MSCRAIALGLLLVLAPFDASAAESKTLFLILLSSGKGDEVILQQLRSNLSATGRVRLTDSASGAELIGKLEVSRTSDSRLITATILKRGGEILTRTRETVSLGGSTVRATAALSETIAAAVSSGRASVEDPPPARETRSTAEPEEDRSAFGSNEEVDERPRSRRRYDDDERDSRPERLSFVFGLELGLGPWLADSSKIIRGSPNGFDFSHYGPAFTSSLDGRWHGTLNLHGGWRFFHAGALEAAVQSSAWGNDGQGAGGAILVGGRLIGFPLQLFMPDREYEVGLELGLGYAFVGGPFYDMSGRYFSLGVTGEYPLNSWLSLQATYRLLMPSLSTFHLDYKNSRTEPVDGFTAYWHTFTVGAAVHIPTKL